MTEPRLISTWDELKECVSDTHTLDIEDYGCGWIHPKNDPNHTTWEGHHYLSTHTFYGSHYRAYTKILRECGFNVQLENWDRKGE